MYDFFELVKDLRIHEVFERWTRKDTCGDDPSPMELVFFGF